jgi:hypothetical protein
MGMHETLQARIKRLRFIGNEGPQKWAGADVVEAAVCPAPFSAVCRSAWPRVSVRNYAALVSMRRANPILRFCSGTDKDVHALVSLIIVMPVKPSDIPGIEAKVKA